MSLYSHFYQLCITITLNLRISLNLPGERNLWALFNRKEMDSRVQRMGKHMAKCIDSLRSDQTRIITESKFMPQATPRPLGYGKLDIKYLQAFFYLCEFIEFNHRVSLSPASAGKTIALLHKSSFRPEINRFGTDAPTWDGVF